MSLFFRHTDNRKFNTWCKYTVRLDTYGCGCQHECLYCYARGLLDFRGNWNSEKPKPGTLWEIKNTVSQLPKNTVVRLGGMTDCFQPIERQKRITYETIKILNYYKIHYLIVTKSQLVSSDEYIRIYDKELVHFQISVTSTNDDTSRSFEKASPPSQRIAAIEKLSGLGFDVSVRLSPFIEQFIDLNTINLIKCDKILIEFLKVNHYIRKWFPIDYSDYTLQYGGYNNLQLGKKINLVNQITGFSEKSVGEYVADHYYYFRENVNFNPDDCCNLMVHFQKRPENKQLRIFA